MPWESVSATTPTAKTSASEKNRAEVEQQGKSAAGASNHVNEGRPGPDAGFELRKPPVDEGETHMPCPVITVCSGGALPGKTDGNTGHFVFGKAALLCYLLHYMTVSIALLKSIPP